jgi:hypothetical protein
MSNGGRKRVPTDDEADVLVLSRRRCCMCLALEKDDKEKEGQVAHLDGDRNNNKPENLAWLCLVHHSRYDSTTSQTKNYQMKEVKKYRQILYDYIKREFHNSIPDEKFLELLQNSIQLVVKENTHSMDDNIITIKTSNLELTDFSLVRLELINESDWELIINKVEMQHKLTSLPIDFQGWEAEPVKGIIKSTQAGQDYKLRFTNTNYTDFELEKDNYIELMLGFKPMNIRIMELNHIYPIKIDFVIDVTIPSKSLDYTHPDVKRQITKTIVFKFELDK